MMRTKKFLAIMMANLLCLAGTAAQTLQTVRGIVYEDATGSPLEYAMVKVMNADPSIGSMTDSLGRFSLRVPVGRHDIEVSFLGYEPVMLKEILVGSSKEVVLNIGMTERLTTLDDLVVTAQVNKAKPLNSMAIAGGRMLSTEEAGRYAGGMDDPARLVSAFAGVSSNVGNNGIVVRGNAPRSLQWRLEDVEIPNPQPFCRCHYIWRWGIYLAEQLCPGQFRLLHRGLYGRIQQCFVRCV